jgi:L-threonylcarbamoyladenylate synthase
MSEPALDRPAIEQAARILEQGGLVAFPTETVYGLGADAESPVAVAKIYAAKGRPSNHPVIVHISADVDVGYWTSSVSTEARRLIDTFWPGPLTLILPRAMNIPDAVSGGQTSIGLRCPSHPVAQALLEIFKKGHGGIAAPSANKFGHVSPTTAQHVRDEFGTELDYILDGGQSEVGIESTILDLSRMATHGPVLLRPGQIGAQRIAEVLGVMPAAPDAAAPRASGTLEAHYAPRTPVALVTSGELCAMLAALQNAGKRAGLMCHSTAAQNDIQAGMVHLLLPAAPSGYAHDLYAALRTLDAAQADIILIETPPDDSDWQAVNDRLRRAAHDSSGALARLLKKKG